MGFQGEAKTRRTVDEEVDELLLLLNVLSELWKSVRSTTTQSFRLTRDTLLGGDVGLDSDDSSSRLAGFSLSSLQGLSPSTGDVDLAAVVGESGSSDETETSSTAGNYEISALSTSFAAARPAGPALRCNFVTHQSRPSR